MATQTFLENLVKKPTWKEVLYELIETKKLDPWNVDIVALADGFVKKIKELEKLELSVPANIILAASILLRYKSEVLVWEEPEPPPVSYMEDEPLLEELPQLTLSSRLAPKRQITANELVKEMEKIIKYEVERPKQKRGGIQTIVELPIVEMDVEKKMNEMLVRLKKIKDEEGWALFSQLVQNREDVIPSLVALLHLAQKERVGLKQDKFFEEIFIAVLKTKKKRKAYAA